MKGEGDWLVVTAHNSTLKSYKKWNFWSHQCFFANRWSLQIEEIIYRWLTFNFLCRYRYTHMQFHCTIFFHFQCNVAWFLLQASVDTLVSLTSFTILLSWAWQLVLLVLFPSASSFHMLQKIHSFILFNTDMEVWKRIHRLYLLYMAHITWLHQSINTLITWCHYKHCMSYTYNQGYIWWDGNLFEYFFWQYMKIRSGRIWMDGWMWFWFESRRTSSEYVSM